MEYGLPKSVAIEGLDYAIRYDYRAVLDVFEVLNEPGAQEWERILAALCIFYPEFEDLPGYPRYEAPIREMFWFINGGKEESNTGPRPRLVAWEKDFPYICAAVNRSIGYEIRSVPYDRAANTGGLHWWTFLSAYMEIGDCLFSQIVAIRSKRAKGKALDKAEKEFYSQNQDIIDIQTRYSEEELDMMRKWL